MTLTDELNCACGCGQPTRSGQSYLHGHWNRTSERRTRMATIKFQGKRTDNGDGYMTIRVDGRGVLEHLVVAAKALGRQLPSGAVVHHVNFDRADNRGENLVICPSIEYHMLLHIRSRAFDACGHADWRRCTFCGQWDATENLYVPWRGSIEHRRCGNEYRKRWMRARRAARRASA